jgi:hypothetical protein
MSILDNYSGVYGGYLTPEERKELGKFAADLLQAKVSKDSSKIEALLKEASLTLTENYEDFEAFVGLVDWLEKHAADVPKDKRANITNILQAVGATMSLAPAIYAGAKWAGRKMQLKKSREQILRDNPALRNEPRFNQYFDMIASFSPEVAAQPILAGNVLENIRRLGPAAVTPQLINDLLGLQGRLAPTTAETLGTVSSGIGRAAEIGAQRFGEIRKEESERGKDALQAKRDEADAIRKRNKLDAQIAAERAREDEARIGAALKAHQLQNLRKGTP